MSLKDGTGNCTISLPRLPVCLRCVFPEFHRRHPERTRLPPPIPAVGQRHLRGRGRLGAGAQAWGLEKGTSGCGLYHEVKSWWHRFLGWMGLWEGEGERQEIPLDEGQRRWLVIALFR